MAWHPLSAGYVKINTDAAFFGKMSCTGVGMVVRGPDGSFVRAISRTKQGCIAVDVGEAWGVLEVNLWHKIKVLRM